MSIGTFPAVAVQMPDCDKCFDDLEWLDTLGRFSGILHKIDNVFDFLIACLPTKIRLKGDLLWKKQRSKFFPVKIDTGASLDVTKITEALLLFQIDFPRLLLSSLF